MQEKTPTPQVTPSKDYATTSMVLGLVALVFIIVGIIPAIIAIIFAIISLRRKTPRRPQAIVGLITGILAIIWSIGAFSLLNYVISTNPFEGLLANGGSSRREQVEARIAAKKDFAVGETARMGVFDLKVTSVERNHIATQDEVLQFEKDLPKEEFLGKESVPIGENVAEYVIVKGTVVGNGNVPLGDHDADMRHMMLNNVEAIYSEGGYGKYAKTGSSDPVEFLHIYRIRKGSETLTLQKSVSIWKAVSNIVGTEGMPREELTYTLRLN